jgi:putative hydrolase
MSFERNRQVGHVLREIGALLEAQHASRYRVVAYGSAAAIVEGLREDVGVVLARGGVEALEALPGIGKSLAATIRDIVRLGYSPILERLRGHVDPEALFMTIPGVGPELARKIHEQLHVETLEELEVAAWDGRLDALPEFGARRVEAIRNGLAAALARVRDRRTGERAPTVDLVLEVDRQYRLRAARGDLPKIAPRRFNPDHAAWLPVLHEDAGGFHFTATWSNTARAHALGRTHDWVVIYVQDPEGHERQCTVVTDDQGRRVVRGL